MTVGHGGAGGLYGTKGNMARSQHIVTTPGVTHLSINQAVIDVKRIYMKANWLLLTLAGRQPASASSHMMAHNLITL